MQWLLYAVRRIALRSPQDCFTQPAGLLYAVRRVAERSPQGCFTQSAGLLSAVEVTLHFNFLDLHFLPDPSTGSGILGCRSIALRSLQHCFTQSAGLLYAARKIAERSRSNTAFQLPRFTFSTGPFDRLRDPFRA